MQEEIRQILFLLIGLGSGILGSLCNYLYHKYSRAEEPTKKGTIKALVLGGIVGILLWITTDGGNGINHMTFIAACFMSGIGAESIVGKIIGRISNNK